MPALQGGDADADLLRDRLKRRALGWQQAGHHRVFELMSVASHVGLPAPRNDRSYPGGNYADIGGLREGDTVVVWKLDRLSRSLKDVLHIMELVLQPAAKPHNGPRRVTPLTKDHHQSQASPSSPHIRSEQRITPRLAAEARK
jgi:resolvase-like protein